LQEAFRRRFHDSKETEAWMREFSKEDQRLHITPIQLFADIDRGHTPTLPHLAALAAATGLPFRRVCQELGVDFNLLPLLHQALGADRTRLALADETSRSRLIDLPRELAPGDGPQETQPIYDFATAWTPQDISALSEWQRVRRAIAYIGRLDNIAHPRLPARASLLIDTSDTRIADRHSFYFVEHPNGYSACRVHLEGESCSLISEDRDRHPRLDFHVRDVRVLGRVLGFSGRIDRLEAPPASVTRELWTRRRSLSERVSVADASPPAMLREMWARQHLTYERFSRRVKKLNHFVSRKFSIARGHIHDLMHDDATASETLPRVDSLFVLAAIFLLDERDLLRGFNIHVDAGVASEDERKQANETFSNTLSHAFVLRLLDRGWDLPWLVSTAPRATPLRRIFYYRQSTPVMAPLLRGEAFITVNVKQRRIAATVNGRPVEELRDWERPIYLLLTATRHRYLCGYCSMEDNMLTIHPHPDAPVQRPIRLRHPDQAIVIGRVTRVSTLLE